MELCSLNSSKIHICQWKIFQSLSHQIPLYLALYTIPSFINLWMLESMVSHYPHSFTSHPFVLVPPCSHYFFFLSLKYRYCSRCFYHLTALVCIFLRWFCELPHSTYLLLADNSQSNIPKHASVLQVSSNKFYRSILHICPCLLNDNIFVLGY